MNLIPKHFLYSTAYSIYKNIYFFGYFRDYIKYKLIAGSKSRFSTDLGDIFPCLGEATESTGFDRHYIYHPAWAARVVKKINPKEHIDISSTLNFCAMLSAFIKVKFYDYRPADIKLDNLTSEAADLMNLPFKDNSVESISCMHVIEHIGLGRYGDPLDPDGDIKAINELKRVVKKGGSLIFVTPMGKDAKIMFNAHRIYTYKLVMEMFSDMKLEEFSLIPEYGKTGGLIRNANKNMLNNETYACGCFWFKKI